MARGAIALAIFVVFSDWAPLFLTLRSFVLLLFSVLVLLAAVVLVFLLSSSRNWYIELLGKWKNVPFELIKFSKMPLFPIPF